MISHIPNKHQRRFLHSQQIYRSYSRSNGLNDHKVQRDIQILFPSHHCVLLLLLLLRPLHALLRRVLRILKQDQLKNENLLIRRIQFLHEVYSGQYHYQGSLLDQSHNQLESQVILYLILLFLSLIHI